MPTDVAAAPAGPPGPPGAADADAAGARGGGAAVVGAVGAPAGYREQVLPTMPSLGRLYTRAVGRTRSLVLARRSVLAGGGLPPVVLRVDGVRADPAQLADYQHLLGEPGTDVLPAGYVHVLAFPLAMAVLVREDFPLPALGMVHVANHVQVLRQTRLGETFTVRAWAQDARQHARGTEVDLVVAVTAGPGAGELVWRGVSTYLAKGRPPAGLAVGPARERPEPPALPAVPTAQWRLGADVGKRYAAVSGDRNPIHVSRLGARMFGFPRPIAHGMYTAARALAATGAGRQGRFTWTATFATPVLLPATVAFGTDGQRYAAWDPRSGKPHLQGAVRPGVAEPPTAAPVP
ncbi:hypothetical protein MF406_17135 [Georgenia sp. TF02-10]|uniref:MaoC/PaaZ C-terminal domain-containing protein n=1 Tax=Georgenia sp. TF02-10 TaxID=2917725 RepID=UPI001FA7CC2A|nr:MaoC/PaaZ C-terminal domain-containing protein [Georgenia sp. TF02-10]UNX54581.1 hypothetical protein MF406_17135 [Georgenia sp. TF02-10]